MSGLTNSQLPLWLAAGSMCALTALFEFAIFRRMNVQDPLELFMWALLAVFSVAPLASLRTLLAEAGAFNTSVYAQGVRLVSLAYVPLLVVLRFLWLSLEP